MDNKFMVHIGSILEEYLEEYEISHKECSLILGVSEKYLSRLLKGEEILIEDIAKAFQKVFPDIPYTYWLNYEEKYQSYVKEHQKNISVLDNIDLTLISNKFKFQSLFNGLNWSLKEQALEMLKILKINNFDEFDYKYSNLEVDFMEDGGELEAIAIWLNLAEEAIEIQNKDLTGKDFDKNVLINSLDKFKSLALNTDYRSSLNSVRKLLNRMGVYLVFEPAIENSKVRGALTSYYGNPAIYLSGRFKTHDHIWFALMHEIGHLIQHYQPNKTIITMEPEFHLSTTKDVKEEEANAFARDFFINNSDYKNFIESESINKSTVTNFALNQNVLPGIVVARLQHDGIISFDELNFLKNK